MSEGNLFTIRNFKGVYEPYWEYFIKDEQEQIKDFFVKTFLRRRPNKREHERLLEGRKILNRLKDNKVRISQIILFKEWGWFSILRSDSRIF